MFAVRAFTPGIGGSAVLGNGSYQNVAQDQSSCVSTSPRPLSPVSCWMVIRASFCQAIGSAKCQRYIETKLFSFRLHPL